MAYWKWFTSCSIINGEKILQQSNPSNCYTAFWIFSMVCWWFISEALALEGFLSNTLIFPFLHWFSQTYRVSVCGTLKHWCCWINSREKYILVKPNWKMTWPKSARGMNTFQFNYLYIKSVTFNIFDEHKGHIDFTSDIEFICHIYYGLLCIFPNRGVKKSHLLFLILAKFKLIIIYFITEEIRVSKHSLKPLFFLQFCSFLNEKMSWMEQLYSPLL